MATGRAFRSVFAGLATARPDAVILRSAATKDLNRAAAPEPLRRRRDAIEGPGSCVWVEILRCAQHDGAVYFLATRHATAGWHRNIAGRRERIVW